MLLPSCSATAQIARDSSVDWLMSAGSEGERYLRALQVAGLAPATQWSIRPFSTFDLSRIAPNDSANPWMKQFRPRAHSSMWIRPVAPEVGGILNSRFPYGLNDGPMWAGRGLTIMGSVGVQGALGPLEFMIAPEFFRAENTSFPIAPNGLSGPSSFADARETSGIDLPQRFGDHPYQRLDPGQSSVRLAFANMELGVSTANELWGPAIDSPFLLGTNAAGFEHVFLAADSRETFGPLRVRARLIAGRLNQSDFSPAPFSKRRRSISGVAVLLEVRQLPGLEFGGARIFEDTWPDSGEGFGDIISKTLRSSIILRPSAAFGGGDAANQIASLFGRWVFPTSGVEVYGELGREDNAADVRDLILEPDHDISYMFGLQRLWKRTDGSMFALHGELLNTEISHLQNVRLQTPPYVHTPVQQGHTQLGQVIGAAGGFGGGATTVSLDWFTSRGRRTITWRRLLTEPDRWAPKPKDVIHALTFENLIFGGRFDLMPEVTLAYNFNRDPGGDAVNFRTAFFGRVHW